MEDFDQVLGSDYKLHLFNGISKKRSGERSGSAPAVKKRTVPDGMRVAQRDDTTQYDGSDMCVELSDGTNLCD